MPPKKELCRNFQRGSCHFGAGCRYLHAAQTNSSSSPFGGNQPQKSNPFGFGVQSGNQSQQTNFGQQDQNRFGFGVQNNSQPRGGFSDFASKPNQTKPFQNTWVRDQPNSGGQPNHKSSQTNAGGQPKTQAPQHKCTDAESCRRVIADDFQNERPVWKLSCYSHLRDGPCDIVGDISAEELRAAAYDDVRRGIGLQGIVERERNLLSSKLQEYEALVRNYNKVPVNPVNSAFGVQNSFQNNTQNTPTVAGTNNPPTLSSFSQFATALNTGSSAPPNCLFGQVNPLQNGSQPSGTFTNQPLGAFTPSGTFPSQTPGAFPPSGAFPSQTPGPFASQTPGPFASQTSGPFTSSGPFGTTPAFQGFGPGSTRFGNTSTISQQNPVFPSTQDFNGSQSGGLTMENTGLNLNMPPENTDEDDSIWTQETWEIGKIPESVPPAKHC